MGIRSQLINWERAPLGALFAIIGCGGSGGAIGAPNDLVGTWNGTMNGADGTAEYLTLQISASGSNSGSVQMGTLTGGQFYGSGVSFQETGTMQKYGSFSVSGTSAAGGAMSVSGSLTVIGGVDYSIIAGGNGQETLNATRISVTFSLGSTNSSQ